MHTYTARLSRGLRIFATSLFIFSLLAVASQVPVQAENADKAVDLTPVGYVVVLNPGGQAGQQAKNLAQAHNASHVYGSVFHGFAANLNAAQVAALKQNPNVSSVELDFTVRMTEVLPTGVDRIDAEKAQAAGSSGLGANVAVIDTGIDLDHPDLAANVNTALSRTFVTKGKTTVGGDDDNGHGTHVAGTIAAVAGNGVGVIGVAPRAKLISLKVLNSQGSGSASNIIAALDYITAHNNASSYANAIHVANCSFGGTGSDTDSAYRRAFDACVASGCFIAVAAGNETDNAANHVPAAYDSVFTVSAMDPVSGGFASFSNYGADVDIAAPGVSIYSTYKGGGYATLSGTSMATPHVAGTAALYVGHNLATLTGPAAAGQIRAALLGSAESVTMPGDIDGFAERLVDAEAVVGPVTPPTPAVNVSITTDQADYSDTDTSAVLTVIPRDEYGLVIGGLNAGQVVTTGAPVLSFAEVAIGEYEVSIDISGFALDVPYTVTVTVTDDRPLTGNASAAIERSTTPPPAEIYVSAISYRVQGPSLFIDITVASTTAGADLSGITVDVTLNRNGTPLASGSAVTAVDGKVSFRLRNASAGHYTTTIDDLSKAGTNYNSALNVSDPGFNK